MVARPWSSSRLSCGERLLLRWDGNTGNSFSTTLGNNTSSRAVAAVSRFHSRGSGDLWLSLEAFPRGFPTRLSPEAFPRGFPTGLSHVPPWCESILGLKVEAVQGKQVPWNGLRYLGDSGNGGTNLEFLSLFLWRAPPLEMRRERREFFPHHAGKGSNLSS